ncbi:MAG: carbohydrate kinase family protein [Bacteroidales bacterium]|nr:carbohydrate kinase family protein [Bacteroidales bacterium]
MRKIIVIGESVLDTLYGVDGQPVKTMVGGRIANATASLGLTGLPVCFCSECCTDVVGDLIVDFFSRHQVSTKSIDRYTDGSTRLSAIFQQPDGSLKVVNYGSYPAADRFNVVWPRIDEGDIVIFGSLYAIDAPQRQRVYELLTYAAERKAVMVNLPGFHHDANFRITRVLTAILENLEHSSVVVAHERDLAEIFPGEDAAAAYRNHIEYYCPCFIHMLASGGIEAFVGKEHWTFEGEVAQNWLGWESGFTAGVTCGLLQEGITAEQVSTITRDTMGRIIHTALEWARSAKQESNCIDEALAKQARKAIDEAPKED